MLRERKKFYIDDEVKEAVPAYFKDKGKTFLYESNNKCNERPEKCFRPSVECIEKEKISPISSILFKLTLIT